MNDQTISCPSCGQLIPLSETLTKQLHTQLHKEYEDKLEKQMFEFEKNEKILLLNKAKIEAQKRMETQLRDTHNQLAEQGKEIEEFKKKSEQGSMQIQGDVQEMDLRRILRERFPSDVIHDVPTGIRGADLIHTVNNQYGQKAGVIVWESKNTTKPFEQKWIMKLKEDKGIVGADVAILVVRIVPAEVNCFSLMQGVWIVEYQYVIPMLRMIRRQLIEIRSIKQTEVGKGEKMEYLYKYISSSQFGNKIDNIISTFNSMRSNLESEKRAIQKIWGRREKEIQRVIESTSSFYGHIEGVIGDSLPKISSLELAEGLK